MSKNPNKLYPVCLEIRRKLKTSKNKDSETKADENDGETEKVTSDVDGSGKINESGTVADEQQDTAEGDSSDETISKLIDQLKMMLRSGGSQPPSEQILRRLSGFVDEDDEIAGITEDHKKEVEFENGKATRTTF